MIANVSYISTDDKMAKRQRYFQFIRIFKKNRTSKTQYLPGKLGKTRKRHWVWAVLLERKTF
jgi:hypothetical protein